MRGTRNVTAAVLCGILALIASACLVLPTPTPEATATVTPTVIPTDIPTPYPTYTPYPTWTVPPTATRTQTPKPSATPTATHTPTPVYCPPIDPALTGNVLLWAWVDDANSTDGLELWDAGEPGVDATVLFRYDITPTILPVFTDFSLRSKSLQPIAVGDVLPGGYLVTLLDFDDQGGCLVPYWNNQWHYAVNASVTTTIKMRFWSTAACSTPTPLPGTPTGTRTPRPTATYAMPTQAPTASPTSHVCANYWTQCKATCAANEVRDIWASCQAPLICCIPVAP